MIIWLYRGDKFQTSFAELGQLRSCLPNIPVLTTTATVTQSTYDIVVKQLAMENVVNLDKNLNRHQCIDCKTQFFVSFKLLPYRIGLIYLSVHNLQIVSLASQFHSCQLRLCCYHSDDQILLSNFSTIVCNILVTELSYYSDTFTDIIMKHKTINLKQWLISAFVL